MITINMKNKATDIRVANEHFSTENNILTLEVMLMDGDTAYDLTGKVVTVTFQGKPMSAPLDVVEGKIQLPIKSSMITKGYNLFQFAINWEDKQELTPKFIWYVLSPIVSGEDVEQVDMISSLIQQVLGIQNAEDVRLVSEQERIDAEELRLSAETDRVDAENTRSGFYSGFNTALAETTTEIFHSKSTDHNSRKAIMTFVDDDGRSEFYTKWKPIIESKSIPVTSALITSQIGVGSAYLTINQIKELKELGVEFVSHSHAHGYLGDFTEPELRADFELSQAFLKQHGLTHDVLVYPYGTQSSLLRRIAREYFSCGVDILEGINVPPISTYRLNRKGWLEGGRATLEGHKAVIDEVVANGGWLIWKTHSQYPEFVGEQLEWISEVIDYARNLGVEIVSVKEGLQRKGNTIDIGDIESASWKNVAIVDSEGNAYGQNIGSHKFISYSESGVDINGDISQFTKNCKTVFQIDIAYVSGLGLPGNSNGLLEVYRGLSNHYGEQIFHRYRSGLKYTRYWNSATSEWSDWSMLNPYAYLGFNGVDSDTPPTNDKLRDRFTSTFINSSGSTGFPENKAGLLLTYANFASSAYPRQEYTVYGTDKKYTRYWSGSAKVWTDWVQLGGGSGSTANRPTSVHTGYMYFDTVLKKPIWWDGTNWLDATGTTV